LHMSDGEQKRQTIFDAYASHLQLLAKEKLAPEKYIEGGVYICPICLREFTSVVGGEDVLTLEDAPPKSLGGAANILTCKSCNNKAGHTIDFHLAERLREMDGQQLSPGTEMPVTVKIDNESYRGKVIVEEDGTMRMFHSKKNNHPVKLEETMRQLEGGEVINVEYIKSRVIPANLEYAVLKSAYLLAFRKLGYTLMLDSCYDVVRQQIQDPETAVYPSGFWFLPPATAAIPGVFFILDEGYEALWVAFNTDTGTTVRTFAALLPLPVRPIGEVTDRINERLKKEKSYTLLLSPFDQDQMNYLTDIPSIRRMIGWLDDRAVKARKELPLF
jgi:hypothetical protein